MWIAITIWVVVVILAALLGWVEWNQRGPSKLGW